MKLTKTQLKQLIKEEIKQLSEDEKFPFRQTIRAAGMDVPERPASHVTGGYKTEVVDTLYETNRLLAQILAALGTPRQP